MLRHIIALLFGTLLMNQWLDIASRPSVQCFVVATSVMGNYSAREWLRCVRACLSRTYKRFRSFEQYSCSIWYRGDGTSFRGGGVRSASETVWPVFDSGSVRLSFVAAGVTLEHDLSRTVYNFVKWRRL
jgi:hypothetical protein